MNMMHLEYLLPVVIFLIWIINSLIRNAQEERQNKRPTRPPGDGLRTPGRSQTEIERFLEEVNRRRRLAAERRESESAPVQIQAATALRRPEVSVARPATVRPATPRPIPTRPSDRGRAEGIVMAELVSAEPVRSEGAVAAAVRPLVAQSVPATAPGEAEVTPPPPGGLTGILGNSDGLRAAFLIREILGPPRCRRNGL
jgi:hypothetical protein